MVIVEKNKDFCNYHIKKAGFPAFLLFFGISFLQDEIADVARQIDDIFRPVFFKLALRTVAV